MIELWEKLKHIQKTSSINQIVENSLIFAKNEKYLKRLMDVTINIDVLLPSNVDDGLIKKLPYNISVHVLKKEQDLKPMFIYIHNRINKHNKPKAIIIHPTAFVDSTAVVGIPGNNITKLDDGRIVNMKHMGNVIIEEDAEIQALSVVHRAVFDSTIIRKNAKIYAKVNIGHNCDIGESTIVCPGSLLAGGTKVGKDCYIWQGVITVGHVSICNNVIIGAGSLVTKDITEPGVYFGTPAKYIKPYNSKLR